MFFLLFALETRTDWTVFEHNPGDQGIYAQDRNKVTLKKSIALVTCLRQWCIKWKAVGDEEFLKRQSIIITSSLLAREESTLSVYSLGKNMPRLEKAI